MQDFSGFLNLFFNSQFFSVLIVILILVLITVLMFLIKSQKNQIKALEAKVENSTNDNFYEAPKIVETPVVKESVTEVKEANNIIIEPVIEHQEVEVKEDIIKINPIEAYEENEEDNAVISTKELEAIEKERDEVLGKENNAKLIEQYEEDQEKKAIISYNELLKNASSLELNYIEKPKEEECAPLVKQVEIKDQPLKGVTYTAEEEYLKLLKEFKASLISSG